MITMISEGLRDMEYYSNDYSKLHFFEKLNVIVILNASNFSQYYCTFVEINGALLNMNLMTNLSKIYY